MKHPSKTRKEILSQVINEKPNLYLGKNGKTIQFINELMRCFDNREIVKIKIQKRNVSRQAQKQLVNEIADEVKAELVDHRGRTFILYKPFEEKSE